MTINVRYGETNNEKQLYQHFDLIEASTISCAIRLLTAIKDKLFHKYLGKYVCVYPESKFLDIFLVLEQGCYIYDRF